VIGAKAEEVVNGEEKAGVEDDGGHHQQHPELVHVLNLLDGALQL